MGAGANITYDVNIFWDKISYHVVLKYNTRCFVVVVCLFVLFFTMCINGENQRIE